MAIDNEKFLKTAIQQGLMTNADADQVRAKLKPGVTVIEASKELGFVTDVQIGQILSAMYSQKTEDGGGLTVEGERCVNHPNRMATRACHRCNKPLCPSCGQAEDGFTFCSDDCLETYREERDEIFMAQQVAARQKRIKTIIAGLVVAAVAATAVVVVYTKVRTSLRLGKARELVQQAASATGQEKLKYLKEALSLDPTLADATAMLPQGYYEAGDYVTAEEKAAALLAKEPGNVELQKVIVKALVAQERYEEALPKCEELRKRGALSPTEVREVGLALVKAGKHDQAIPLLEDAYKRQEQDRQVALVLGEYYMSAGNHSAALPYLEAVVDNTVTGDRQREITYQSGKGNLARAYVLLAKVAGAKHDTTRLSGIMTQINTLRSRGLADEGDTVRVAEAWVPIADVAQLPLVENALKSLTTAAGIPGLTRVMGLLESRKGNFIEAARLLEKCLLEDPGDTSARRYLLDYYITNGRYAEARKHLDALRDAGTKGLEFDVAEATMLVGEGKLEEALSKAEKILAIYPDNPDILGLAARVYIEMNRTAEAMVTLNRLVTVAPSLWSYFQSMLFSLRLGDKQTAIELARRTLANLAAVPTDLGARIKQVAGVVTGEVDASVLPEQRLSQVESRLLDKARTPGELIGKAVAGTLCFTYMSMIISGESPVNRNNFFPKIMAPSHPGVTITDAYTKKLTAPLADGLKDGFGRIMAFYDASMPSADWKNELASVMSRYQTDSNRAAEGSDRVSAMLKCMRDGGLVCYQANRRGSTKPGKMSTSMAILKGRFELEEMLISSDAFPVLYARQALEAFALAVMSLQNGGLVSTAMTNILRDDAYNAVRADDGIEQFSIHMLYLCKAVAALSYVIEATNLSNILRQTITAR